MGIGNQGIGAILREIAPKPGDAIENACRARTEAHPVFLLNL